MQPVAQKISRILELTRQTGYLTPDQGIAIAGSILEVRPLPPEFSRLAPALIRQAALFNPFDREKVRLAQKITQQTDNPPFSDWLASAMDLTANDPIPDNAPYPDTKSAPAEDFVTYLKQQKANGMRLPALLHLWQQGEKKALIQAIELMTATRSGILASPLLAWGAYGAGKPQLAKKLLDEGVNSFLAMNLRARMALDDGQQDLAVTNLIGSLDFEPFQPCTLELLAELLSPVSMSVPGNDVHICLYTWNKPDLLARTLESLAGSDIGAARITILNNGTTVCSAGELENRIRECAPDLDVKWEHLPVNIGAPAARNWLLAMPDVRQCRYVAFLDDDVLLPRYWLRRYIATLERFPQAAAVGPKCINESVRTIQYAFRNFEEIGENKIRFTANAPTLMDMGQFDAARPSLTVMGCCHLFRMDRMNELDAPDFDIRFSPSQVDDIEHDLQIWKAGGQVIYDGGVSVVHLQDTGKARTRANIGQAYANHFKMENKFTLEELQRMDRDMKEADRDHFRQVVAIVVPTLTAPAANFWKQIGT